MRNQTPEALVWGILDVRLDVSGALAWGMLDVRLDVPGALAWGMLDVRLDVSGALAWGVLNVVLDVRGAGLGRVLYTCGDQTSEISLAWGAGIILDARIDVGRHSPNGTSSFLYSEAPPSLRPSAAYRTGNWPVRIHEA